MKKRTYLLCLLLVAAAVVILLEFGVASGNPIVMVLIPLGGIGAIYLCRRNVTEVVSDDLSEMINGKAALKTLEIVIIIAAAGFVGTTSFYWNGGWGVGTGNYDNGSVYVHYVQFYPHGSNVIYEGNYLIDDPANMTCEDVSGLNRMISTGVRMQDYPYVFGAALGFIVVLLAILYASFSLYYNRKYGCTDDEKQD